MKSLLVLCLILFSVTVSAGGGFQGGKKYNFLASDLSSGCVDGEAEKRGVCLGYINGVAAMQKKACIPSNVKFVKLQRAVERYMEDNPDELNKHAFKVVEKALADTWPCK